MIDPRLYLVAGALAVAFGAGWAGNGWRLGGRLENLKAEHSEAVATAARTALNAQRALDDKRDALAATLAGIDSAESLRLKAANDETNRLRACIADGTCGLRLAATCPAASAVVPGAAPGGRVDTGAGAQLTPAAQRDYFALRDGIARAQAKLTACQAALRAERDVAAIVKAVAR